VKDYEAKKAKKGQKGEDSSVEKAAEAWLKFLLSQIIQTPLCNSKERRSLPWRQETVCNAHKVWFCSMYHKDGDKYFQINFFHLTR
jgi:hypothetical protein